MVFEPTTIREAMYPTIIGIPLYHCFWGLAALTWVLGGAVRASKMGFSGRRSLAALVFSLVAFLIGARLQESLWEHRPGHADTRPLGDRGQRLPGGVVASALLVPLAFRSLGLPLLRFMDAVVPVAAMSLAVGRLGCFFNGCCFGEVTSVPWGMRFPPGSRPETTHRLLGMVDGTKPSLPVHPLQLYYIVVYLTIAFIVMQQSKVGRYEGWSTHVFCLLWAWSTFVLEQYRSADALRLPKLNQPLSLFIALSMSIVVVALEIRHRRSSRGIGAPMKDQSR